MIYLCTQQSAHSSRHAVLEHSVYHTFCEVVRPSKISTDLLSPGKNFWNVSFFGGEGRVPPERRHLAQRKVTLSLSLWGSVNNEFINRRAALPPLWSRRKEALSHLSKLWPASLVVGRYYCCTVCRRRWLWAGNGAGKFQRNAKPGGENGTEPRLEENLLWVLGDFSLRSFAFEESLR